MLPSLTCPQNVDRYEAKGVGMGTSLLVRAAEIVMQEEPHEAILATCDGLSTLVHFHVRVIGDNVWPRNKSQPPQSVGRMGCGLGS